MIIIPRHMDYVSLQYISSPSTHVSIPTDILPSWETLLRTPMPVITFPLFARINSSDAPSRNSILPVKKGALISNLREILTNPTTGSQLSFEDFLTRSPREAIADIIDYFSSDAHQQLYSLSVPRPLSQRLIKLDCRVPCQYGFTPNTRRTRLRQVHSRDNKSHK
jgi:hypothetical protein